jgi:hypothetical protein
VERNWGAAPSQTSELNGFDDIKCLGAVAHEIAYNYNYNSMVQDII